MAYLSQYKFQLDLTEQALKKIDLVEGLDGMGYNPELSNKGIFSTVRDAIYKKIHKGMSRLVDRATAQRVFTQLKQQYDYAYQQNKQLKDQHTYDRLKTVYDEFLKEWKNYTDAYGTTPGQDFQDLQPLYANMLTTFKGVAKNAQFEKRKEEIENTLPKLYRRIISFKEQGIDYSDEAGEFIRDWQEYYEESKEYPEIKIGGKEAAVAYKEVLQMLKDAQREYGRKGRGYRAPEREVTPQGDVSENKLFEAYGKMNRRTRGQFWQSLRASSLRKQSETNTRQIIAGIPLSNDPESGEPKSIWVKIPEG